jgi:beta-phosphoglucomutase
LVDTEEYHRRAWQRLWHDLNITVSDEDFRRTFGQRNDTILREILGNSLTADAINQLSNRKEAYYREEVRGRVTALPGVMDLLHALHAEGIPCAVTSSGPKANIDLILGELGLGRLFSTVVSGNDVPRGKPDPDLFLMAAARLQLPPRRCVVIEDAPAGIRAAHAAGMPCLAVTTTHNAATMWEADRIVTTLFGITPMDLVALLETGPLQRRI